MGTRHFGGNAWATIILAMESKVNIASISSSLKDVIHALRKGKKGITYYNNFMAEACECSKPWIE